jgi:hypothetical protein
MRAFLSYSHTDSEQAALLAACLEQEANLELTSQALDVYLSQSTPTFTERLREHDAVLHVISASFLKSQICMRELLEIMKDDEKRDFYHAHTVPILIDDDSRELFSDIGQLRLLKYWVDQKGSLEDEIGAREGQFGPEIDRLRVSHSTVREITEHVRRFIQTVGDNGYAAHYQEEQKASFVKVISSLREIEAAPSHEKADQASSKGVSSGAGVAARTSRRFAGFSWFDGKPSSEYVDGASEEIRRLIRLNESIVVASESDPKLPEFPPFSPRFPATPAQNHHIERLGRTIVIKDESQNFTGSHKDRMAWEIVVYYKKLIQDRLTPHSRKPPELPAPSIISNGSAAVAIQTMLRCFALPSLKVLVDHSLDEPIKHRLRLIGCEVFEHDLSEAELDSTDVLRLTKNEGGFDVTARDLIDPNTRTYYDWLAYEILNCGAKHIFIPVGTGDLFVNVLTVLRDERLEVANDSRLDWDSAEIHGVTLYGATSSVHNTKMYKLYAPHRPTLQDAYRLVEEMQSAGHCGDNSQIYDVKENVVPVAMGIAAGLPIHCDESGIAGLSLLLQLYNQLQIPPEEKILVVNTGWLPAVGASA